MEDYTNWIPSYESNIIGGIYVNNITTISYRVNTTITDTDNDFSDWIGVTGRKITFMPSYATSKGILDS
jgi:hypothetical protein